MASKHREQHIIESTPCPVCGAAVGELCRMSRTLPRTRAKQRPILHTERRLAWQEAKRGLR